MLGQPDPIQGLPKVCVGLSSYSSVAILRNPRRSVKDLCIFRQGICCCDSLNMHLLFC